MHKSTVRWMWVAQAVSGLGLVGFVLLHWIAQHYIASGGLRSYADVVAYLEQPWLLALEISFLGVVTAHALLGVRAILLDLGPSPRLARLLNLGLFIAGIATVWYGVSLVSQIIR
jgi:succinate dehydrogenase hydrophobic anchor subunit